MHGMRLRLVDGIVFFWSLWNLLLSFAALWIAVPLRFCCSVLCGARSCRDGVSFALRPTPYALPVTDLCRGRHEQVAKVWRQLKTR